MRRKRLDNQLNNQLGYVNKTVDQEVIRTENGETRLTPKYNRYYSQIDANIYIGDFLVSDIQNISYGLKQNDMPLFGYNSYIFDEMALGNRIIQGVFTINFTEPRYIDKILKNHYTSLTSFAKEVKIEQEGQKEDGKLPDIKIPSRNEDTVINSPEHNSRWRQKFDIDITYGEDDQIMGKPLHVTLLDCYITDVQTVLDVSGRPILEQYSFISRDSRAIV